MGANISAHPSEETQIRNQVEIENEPQFQVKIDEELLESIVEDINNQNDPSKQQALLDLQREQARKEAYNQKLEEWTIFNNQRQKKLDEQLDSLSAKIHDLTAQVEYDSKRLEERWTNRDVAGNEACCVEQRSSLIQCFNKKKSADECAEFIRIMEKCVSEAVVG